MAVKMEEKIQDNIQNDEVPRTKRRAPSGFFKDLLAGYGIGIAFIIPGFSGGSMAAIFGVYEKLVGAVADVFRHPKKSISTLLPIFIGLALGVVSLLYPLKWALSMFPIPTVALFVGLTMGAMPSVLCKVKGRIKSTNVVAFLIPLTAAVSICFLPSGSDVDLLGLSFGGYLLLFVVGIIGSSALVVPGISGSMLLLILGYYNPLVSLITDHLFKGQNLGRAVLVLGSVALGIAIGFFLVSVLMRWLLSRYTRGTYFAIVGFIVGSLPAAFISTIADARSTAPELVSNPWHWGAAAVMIPLGALLAYLVVRRARALGVSE